MDTVFTDGLCHVSRSVETCALVVSSGERVSRSPSPGEAGSPLMPESLRSSGVESWAVGDASTADESASSTDLTLAALNEKTSICSTTGYIKVEKRNGRDRMKQKRSAALCENNWKMKCCVCVFMQLHAQLKDEL